MGIGDELMAAGEARAHYDRTGRPVRMLRQVVRERWYDIWDGLPYLLRPGEQREHDVMYAKTPDGLRRYIEAKTDARWEWRAYEPKPAEVVLTDEERELARTAAGAVLIEPRLKPQAPVNKQWGTGRWKALMALRPDLDWVQVGPAGVRPVPGARHIETSSFRRAVAVLSGARAAVLPEGGLHHAAAAVGTPAVVIFGGYIAPAVTGYATQRSLFVASNKWPLGCGARQPCRHCEAAMAAITPQMVLKELEALL